jgi:peptide deformylase
MEILGIRLWKDPILHQPTELVNEFNEELFKVMPQMLTATRLNNGVGLSANQVGLPQRFCVVLYQGQPSVFINPVITKKSKEKDKMSEGCLSAPRMHVVMKRAKQITVRWQDLAGKEHIKDFTGMEARILQHECDHLDGKMIIDSITGAMR